MRGMGRLMRCHGLACDNLESVQIVTADGQLRRASATENADLFWGIRGGGGNFGVVTNLAYRLHPLTGNGSGWRPGLSIQPGAKCHDRRRRTQRRQFGTSCYWARCSQTRPPERGTRPGRFIVLEATYIGDPREGARQLAPLQKLGTPLSDDIEAKSYLVAQGAVSTAPVAVPTALSSYTKTGFLRGAPSKLIAELALRFAASPPTLAVEVICAQMGGAVARVPPVATAFWNRASTHDVLISGDWSDRSQDQANIAAIRTIWDAVEPYTQGFYVNTEPDATARRVRTHLRWQLRTSAAAEKQIRPRQPVPPERKHQADGVRIVRMKTTPLAMLVLAGLAGGAAVDAHHSFAMFDQSRMVTLHGVVKDFRWSNPHVFIQLVAGGRRGRRAGVEHRDDEPRASLASGLAAAHAESRRQGHVAHSSDARRHQRRSVSVGDRAEWPLVWYGRAGFALHHRGENDGCGEPLCRATALCGDRERRCSRKASTSGQHRRPRAIAGLVRSVGNRRLDAQRDGRHEPVAPGVGGADAEVGTAAVQTGSACPIRSGRQSGCSRETRPPWPACPTRG